MKTLIVSLSGTMILFAGFAIGQSTSQPTSAPTTTSAPVYPYAGQIDRLNASIRALEFERRQWWHTLADMMEADIRLAQQEADLDAKVNCALTAAKCAWCGVCRKTGHTATCPRAALDASRRAQREHQRAVVEAYRRLVGPER